MLIFPIECKVATIFRLGMGTLYAATLGQSPVVARMYIQILLLLCVCVCVAVYMWISVCPRQWSMWISNVLGSFWKEYGNAVFILYIHYIYTLYTVLYTICTIIYNHDQSCIYIYSYITIHSYSFFLYINTMCVLLGHPSCIAESRVRMVALQRFWSSKLGSPLPPSVWMLQEGLKVSLVVGW